MPQNIPSAIVLTLGNKVVLYCKYIHQFIQQVALPSVKLSHKEFSPLDQFNMLAPAVHILMARREPSGVRPSFLCSLDLSLEKYHPLGLRSQKGWGGGLSLIHI